MSTGPIKRYNSIDICKLCMAVVVVAIHTEPLINCNIAAINQAYRVLTRLAVPFFFVTSGFLLAKRMNWPHTDKESLIILRRTIIRMINLYIFWNIVYFPLAMIQYIRSGESVLRCFVSYVRGFFLIGEHYNSWMLWYLLSAIYGLVLIYIWLWKQSPFKIVIVCMVTMLISWGIDWLVNTKIVMPVYIDILRKVFCISIRNGRLFTGIYFLLLGMLLAYKSLSKKWGIMLMITGIGGGYSGQWFSKHGW